MKEVLVCKTCLITNVKMFHLDTLLTVYSELTGLPCDDETTEYVCYECAALLLKFQQFRTKCLRANQVISEFIRKYCKITKDVVNMIDRKLYNLESTINKFDIKDNIFNEFYNEPKFVKNENEEPEQSINIEIVDIISDIKDEVEPYDDKDQTGSDENESLYLEDDISLDEDPIIFLVQKETQDESTKIKKMGRQPVIDYSFMDEYITTVNLTPEEAKNEILLRKESNNYKKNLYKCDLCYRGYGTLKTYENHMKKHNKDIGECICDYCYGRFSKQRYLRRHIGSCHTTKFYCKSCPFTCFSIHHAKVHVNMHKGKIYPCEECGEIFSMPNSLSTHQRYKHTSEFVCALCGTVFGKERGLKQHINLLHKQDTNDQKGPLCEECDVHFATETAWKRHLVLSCKHTVSNGCGDCGETFDSKDELRIHARVHPWRNKSKPKNLIKCTLRETTFVGNKVQDTHLSDPEMSDKLKKVRRRRDKPVKYVCEVCGKICKSQSVYLCHQKVHSNERPYSCSECGKSFKLKYLLKIHLSTHSSVPAYKCNQCPKTFVFRNSLDKHLKVHLGIRPHKCNICDKSFPTPCEVKYHTQYVHQKLPWPKRDRSKRKKSTRHSSPEIS